jgi:hypothetical protein
MNDCQPPRERAFPAALLCKQKEYLISEITRDIRTRPHRSRSLVLRFALALVAVTAIVVGVSVIGDGGLLQPLTMAQALEAITPAEGEVLHIKTSEDSMAEYPINGGLGGNSTDGTPRVEEIWARCDSQWKWRWAWSGGGVEAAEMGGDHTGLHMVYDSKSNTILEGRQDPPPNKISGDNYLGRVRELLASGRVEMDGHEVVNGRDAVRIVEKRDPEKGIYNENVYLMDAKTGIPLEYRMMNEGLTIHYEVYEMLPGTPENLRMLDMKTAHPDATVYTEWEGWNRAVWPDGED